MTLNEILTNIQFGEKYTEMKALTESLQKCYDKDLDIFYASKRCKELTGNIVMSEGEELKVNRIISKLCILEDRLETGKLMSDGYRKMQSTAIMEDCKALQNEITKTRKVDSKKLSNLGKIIATTKYFVENNVDEAAVLESSSNPLLNKIIKEEKENIESVEL